MVSKMGKLVAVAGLAGADKTTATDHLESIGLGRRVYVGALVLNEVRRQGLQVGAENEKLVRVALRRTNGPHALAALAAPVVMDILGSGTNVLLDAIFNIEESFEELCGNQVFLLAIAASFDVRADRLQHHCLRALTKDQLKARDETELNVLRTDLVFSQSTGARWSRRSISIRPMLHGAVALAHRASPSRRPATASLSVRQSRRSAPNLPPRSPGRPSPRPPFCWRRCSPLDRLCRNEIPVYEVVLREMFTRIALPSRRVC
jgi:hypothetical protein